MFKMHGWRIDLSIHNYLYFVFYYPYVKSIHLALRLVRYLTWLKPLSFIGRMIFDRYHAKILSLENTEKIFRLDENISIVSPDNKKVIPYKYATKIIFQEPENIVVMDCPCKKSNHAVEEDINSCLAIGSDITSFWLEHCKKYHPRRICREEALTLIKRFRKKHHITQAFFKGATGGKTGVICNCHPDTCVSLQATRLSKKIDPGLSMSAESGYSVKYHSESCGLCLSCIRVCPFNVLEWKDEKRQYDREACMGCALCTEHCPNEALSLYPDPGKTAPLDLEKLVE